VYLLAEKPPHVSLLTFAYTQNQKSALPTVPPLFMIICGLLHQQVDARLNLETGSWVLQGCVPHFNKEDTSR